MFCLQVFKLEPFILVKKFKRNIITRIESIETYIYTFDVSGALTNAQQTGRRMKPVPLPQAPFIHYGAHR